jgi:hypothetical protein
MLVVLVHGWGVQSADYGPLPGQLRAALGAETAEIRLSEYISYSDAVTLPDLAHAFERVRRSQFPDRPFACVTHSTGGPILRLWLDLYHGPMTHLIMLAPPNHGSALAQLGKSRLSRMKSWLAGVEPGQQILDWLELGSHGSWELNLRWLRDPHPVRMAVIIGDTPDRRLYDHLNSYTGERGSDGVVRLAAANLNYRYLRLRQHGGALRLAEARTSRPVPFVVAQGASHGSILDLQHAAGVPTASTSMAVFRVRDDTGRPVRDFDLLLTAGPDYDPDALPRGFFLDRQRNLVSPESLTYYFNHAALARTPRLGIRIRPRPDSGPVRYAACEFRGEMFVEAHQTTLVDIELERVAAPRLFRLI